MFDENGIIDWFAESQFHISPSGNQRDLFTPEHTKFDVMVSHHGAEYTTNYQCNTRYMQPTPMAVMGAILSDAASVGYYGDIDDFAENLGFEKPSQAIKAWEGCKASRDALVEMGLEESAFGELEQYLEEADEKEFTGKVENRRKELDIDKPELPEGWSYIEDLQADLDLGDYGEEIADYGDYICDAISEVADSNVDIYTADLRKWIMESDNDKWIEEAQAQGLLEGVTDFTKMIQVAQYECFTADLYKHQEDAVRNAIFEHLKDDHDAVAISDELAERIADIDCSDNNDRFDDLFEQADDAVAEVCDDSAPGLMNKEEVRRAAKGECSKEENVCLDGESRDMREASGELRDDTQDRSIEHSRSDGDR